MTDVVKRVAELAQGLPVKVESVAKNVEKYGLLHAGRLAAQSLHYPDQQLGGRLLIHHLRATTPRTLVEYVEENKDLLRPEISRFLLLHADTLQAVMQEMEATDLRHDFFSADTQSQQYLLRPIKDAPYSENFQQLHLRMAAELFHRDGVDAVITYYRARMQGFFTHATPTILNCGLVKNQLASCFVFHIGDNLESILYEGVGDVGIVSKHNGGIGMSLSDLRHSEIGRDGMAKGLAPIMHLFNASNRLVDQGGTRKGAMTLTLHPQHLDVRAFVRTVVPQATGVDKHAINEDINTCVWSNDVWFERIRAKGQLTLFCPKKAASLRPLYGAAYRAEYLRLEQLAARQKVELKQLEADLARLETGLGVETEEYYTKKKAWARLKKEYLTHEVVDAVKLFDEVIDAQMQAGRPFVCQGDSATRKSNHRHLGRIRTSNLCQEIMLYTDEKRVPSCNLASMVLCNYVRGAYDPEAKDIGAELRRCFDFEEYGRLVRLVVRGLNKVIDHTWYPLDKRDAKGNVTEQGSISKTNLADRPLGLGTSGLADAIAMLDLPFVDAKDNKIPDPRTRLFNQMVFACHYYNALAESVDLAMRTQPYATFKFTDEEGKERVSPFAEGKLQFDLWREEYLEQTANGSKPHPARKYEEDEPLPPATWGQPTLRLYNGLELKPEWAALRSAVKGGIRNSTLTALMPTATTSQIMCATESVEAPQTNIYSRKTGTRAYLVVNRHLYADLTQLGLNLDGVMNFIAAEDGSVQQLRAFVEAQIRRSELEAALREYVYEQVRLQPDRTAAKLEAARAEHEAESKQRREDFLGNPDSLLADRRLALAQLEEEADREWAKIEAPFIEEKRRHATIMAQFNEVKALGIRPVLYAETMARAVQQHAPRWWQQWQVEYGQQQPLYPLLAQGYLSIEELASFLKHGAKGLARLDYLQLKYRTMWELSCRIFLRLAADRARYVDQSQSMNMYLKEPTKAQVQALLLTAESLGLKTLMYYLRRMPAIRTSQFGATKAVAQPAVVAEAKKEASPIEKTVSAQVTPDAKDEKDPLPKEEVCRRAQIDGKPCFSCS